MKINIVQYESIDYWETVRLREIVLRLPLYKRFRINDLEKEVNELIIVMKSESEEIIATNQFLIQDQHAKMRQVATKEKFQAQGIGTKLYIESEKILREMGIREINCHARQYAVSFYLKLGFEKTSEEFMEVGIPHVEMRKLISKVDSH